MIREDCFAYKNAGGRPMCTALKELYCKKEDCKWYKLKSKEWREVKQATEDTKKLPVLPYKNKVDTGYIKSLFGNDTKSFLKLCNAVGIAHATYYRMLDCGQASMGTLIKISKYFNVEPETLLRKE